MSLILNIDTAVDTALISIARDGVVIAQCSNGNQKEHGGFLQPAIAAIVKEQQLDLKDMDAIAVSAGPGSYTGLRVGMATAKGLSFALGKPLITVGTLDIIAMETLLQIEGAIKDQNLLICPMIDARRMEVFTALFTNELEQLLAPVAMIPDESSFVKWMLKYKIVFCGNGALKFKQLFTQENATFFSSKSNPLAMSNLSFQKYSMQQFADTAYSEPMYVKEFYTNAGKS